MQYCKDELFKKLYKPNKAGEYLSKYEILTMLALLSYCDDNGRITIYHQDIEKKTGAAVNTFYSTLHKLIQKKLIIMETKDHKSDINVKVCDYSFRLGKKGREYRNFVKLDIEGLSIDRLRELTLTELRLVLYIYFRCAKSGNPYKVLSFNKKSFKKEEKGTYQTIAGVLEVSSQAIRKAITMLQKRNIISFTHRTPRIDIFDKRNSTSKDEICFRAWFIQAMKVSVTDQFIDPKTKLKTHRIHDISTTRVYRSDRHIIRNIIRRSNKRRYLYSTAFKQIVNDIANLLGQYRQAALDSKKHVADLIEVISKAISNECILSAIAVHKAIKEWLYYGNAATALPF